MNVRRAAAKVLLDFGHAHKSLLVRDHENKTPLEVVGSAYRHSPNQGAIPHHLLVDLANREANLQKLLAEAAREQKVRSNSTVH
jgi:signal recognition particle GTPase